MYRGFVPRYIFFAQFLEKNREKIHFRRYFRALSPQPFNVLSYSESFRMCTGFIECMRCDRLTFVIFRAAGSIFASRSALLRARFHHETASRHRAANHAKRAASAACSCASIVEPRTPKRG